jgi:hypothetical protein
MSLADNFREKKYDGKNKPDLNVRYNTIVFQKLFILGNTTKKNLKKTFYS